MKSFLKLAGAATMAAAAEYDAEAKTLKFELQQTATPAPFNTSSYVSNLGALNTGYWNIGLELKVGDAYYENYIVLNDQSTPVMTVDFDNGCSTCLAANSGVWGVGNAAFSMTNSATYNWTAAVNSTVGISNANLTMNGTQGTVDCTLWMTYTSNLNIASVPVTAVSNYNMTNTSWWLNEFQFYGSIGFGRPAANDTTSTSFLTALIANQIINSTTWTYTPSSPLTTGVITVGGLDATQTGSVYYTATPVNTAMPDEWMAPLSGVSMSIGPYALNNNTQATNLAQSAVTNVEISTGYQYIGLPSSIWNALCTALNTFVQVATPDNLYAGSNNVYCNSTSNVNRLLTMDPIAAGSVIDLNFTVAM
jgi:hypothetical protein